MKQPKGLLLSDDEFVRFGSLEPWTDVHKNEPGIDLFMLANKDTTGSFNSYSPKSNNLNPGIKNGHNTNNTNFADTLGGSSNTPLSRRNLKSETFTKDASTTSLKIAGSQNPQDKHMQIQYSNIKKKPSVVIFMDGNNKENSNRRLNHEDNSPLISGPFADSGISLDLSQLEISSNPHQSILKLPNIMKNQGGLSAPIASNIKSMSKSGSISSPTILSHLHEKHIPGLKTWESTCQSFFKDPLQRPSVTSITALDTASKPFKMPAIGHEPHSNNGKQPHNTTMTKRKPNRKTFNDPSTLSSSNTSNTSPTPSVATQAMKQLKKFFPLGLYRTYNGSSIAHKSTHKIRYQPTSQQQQKPSSPVSVSSSLSLSHALTRNLKDIAQLSPLSSHINNVRNSYLQHIHLDDNNSSSTPKQVSESHPSQPVLVLPVLHSGHISGTATHPRYSSHATPSPSPSHPHPHPHSLPLQDLDSSSVKTFSLVAARSKERLPQLIAKTRYGGLRDSEGWESTSLSLSSSILNLNTHAYLSK
jgi:hypothetical protein